MILSTERKRAIASETTDEESHVDDDGLPYESEEGNGSDGDCGTFCSSVGLHVLL